MKLKGLNFKILTGCPERNKPIIEALKKIGVILDYKYSADNLAAIEVVDGEFGYWIDNPFVFGNFNGKKTQELTLKEALTLINSVKPEVPEFDIKTFDKIIYRVDDRRTTNWSPGFYAQIIRGEAWGIGSEKSMFMFVKYEGNEKYVGNCGFKTDKLAYPDGWWEVENGKPVWKRRENNQ